MTAIGVMRQAYDQNIRVPEDLSVVGFDDIRIAEFTIPPLTTVQMSQKELAKIAFQALLNEVEGDPALARTPRIRTDDQPGAQTFYGIGPGRRPRTASPKRPGRRRARNTSGTLPR